MSSGPINREEHWCWVALWIHDAIRNPHGREEQRWKANLPDRDFSASTRKSSQTKSSLWASSHGASLSHERPNFSPTSRVAKLLEVRPLILGPLDFFKLNKNYAYPLIQFPQRYQSASCPLGFFNWQKKHIDQHQKWSQLVWSKSLQETWSSKVTGPNQLEVQDGVAGN